MEAATSPDLLPDTDLMGEPVRKPPKSDEQRGTLYVVFEQRFVRFRDREEDAETFAWVQISDEDEPVRAAGQRAAITAVAGHAPGTFMAVPSASAQPHRRREDTRLVWDDE